MWSRIGFACLMAWMGVVGWAYVGPFRWWAIVPVMLVCAGVSWWQTAGWKTEATRSEPLTWERALIAISVSLIDVLLLIVAWSARTTDPLVSPWQRVPAIVTLGFATSSFLLIFFWRVLDRWSRTFVVALHATVMWGICEVIFAYGYGFDPFLHRAAETALARDGAIHPTPLYYMGQYALVSAWHLLTHVPVSVLDRCLVPASAIALASWLAWRDRSPVLFLFLLTTFTFTVPYQLALVLGLAGILTYDRRFSVAWIVLSCLSHPLIGIPFGVFVVLREIRTWTPWRVLGAMLGAFVMISAPLWIYAWWHGQIMIPSWSTLLDVWFPLFGSPYRTEYLVGWWGIMFRLAYVWPALMGLGGLIIAWRMRDVDRVPLWCVMSVLPVSAVLVFAMTRFDNIISNEQGEFAMRWLHLVPLFTIPVWDRWLTQHVWKFRYRWVIALIGSVVMTFVWWNTQPQIHPAAWFYAPSLSQFDVDAVHRVDEDAKHFPYILLAHQLGSAGAVHEFGYDREVQTDAGKRYFAAIPTGGELFAWYQRALTDPDPRSAMQEAMQFAHVSRAYVLIPTWFDPSGEIANRLRRVSEAEIQSPEIWIFRFTRATE